MLFSFASISDVKGLYTLKQECKTEWLFQPLLQINSLTYGWNSPLFPSQIQTPQNLTIVECCSCIAEKSIPVKDLKYSSILLFPVSSSRLESGTQNGVLNAEGCQNGSQTTLNPQPTPILDQGTVQINLQFTRLKTQNGEEYSAFM